MLPTPVRRSALDYSLGVGGSGRRPLQSAGVWVLLLGKGGGGASTTSRRTIFGAICSTSEHWRSMGPRGIPWALRSSLLVGPGRSRGSAGSRFRPHDLPPVPRQTVYIAGLEQKTAVLRTEYPPVPILDSPRRLT